MKFDWQHYITVQLQWADCLLARCQENQGRDADDLLAITRDRLRDVARLTESVANSNGELSTCH